MIKVIRVVSIIICLMLLPLSQVFAIQVNVTIFAQEDVGFGKLQAEQLVEIKNVKSHFVDKEGKVVSFTADMNTPGVKELRDLINNKLANELGSTARFDNLTINYIGKLSQDGDSILGDVKLVIDFTIRNIVTSGSTTSPSGAITDLNWRGFVINEPVIINAPGIGEIDINSIHGLINKISPQLASSLEASDKTTVHTPLLNLADLKLPLSNWHASFDASGAVAEAGKYGLAANVPPVITIFARGESSLREGIVRETEIVKNVSIDGSQAELRLVIPPASSQIKMAGYAKAVTLNGKEYAKITDFSTGEQIYQSQNLPLIVLAVFAGMAAVIAGVIIWRVNKKK